MKQLRKLYRKYADAIVFMEDEPIEIHGKRTAYWDSHPDAPIEQWVRHVQIGVTRSSYWCWTQTKKEGNKYRKEHPEKFPLKQACLWGNY